MQGRNSGPYLDGGEKIRAPVNFIHPCKRLVGALFMRAEALPTKLNSETTKAGEAPCTPEFWVGNTSPFTNTWIISGKFHMHFYHL